jgi:hypothetical protein
MEESTTIKEVKQSPVYQVLATAADAYMRLCDSEHESGEWIERWENRFNEIVKEHFPSGGGFDCGTKSVISSCGSDKLVFTTEFHHMDEYGGYDGWTEHTITVTPSLSRGYSLKVSGKNRNDIKDYIADTFGLALDTMINKY